MLTCRLSRTLGEERKYTLKKTIAIVIVMKEITGYGLIFVGVDSEYVMKNAK